jgi:hypothetical protein
LGNSTLIAIRERDWEDLGRRKEVLAHQAEANALLAGDHITHILRTTKPGKIPLAVLNNTYGINIDKTLTLRGDPAFTIKHEHNHRITDDDILAFALARSKVIEATVIDPQSPGNDVGRALSDVQR